MNGQEDQLLQAFDWLIYANQSRIPKILDFEQQLFQFDVKDQALPSHFQVVINNPERQNTQLYLNNHFTSVHYEESFADLKYIKKGQLERRILKDIYEHDVDLMGFQFDQNQVESEMLDIGYKRALDEVDLHLKNPFTTTFSYDYMDNEFTGFQDQMVQNNSFKNYSTDQSQDNTQQQQKGQQLLNEYYNQGNASQEINAQQVQGYQSQNNIVEDFQVLGNQVEQYLAELRQKQQSIKNRINIPQLSLEDLIKVNKFSRVLSIFQKAGQKEAKKHKVIQKSTVDMDPEEIFKQLKSEWVEEQKEEEELKQSYELQILANLDFDVMIDKVEEKIQFEEQQLLEKVKKMQEELKSQSFEMQEDQIYSLGQQNKMEQFNKIKLVDTQEINEKKLQLSSSYDWAVEDQFNLAKFYEEVPKEKMAQQYPFELDAFQKRSVYRIERKESVFVCAHTSAGKTVVAEYAIAISKKLNRKAIYTSPIKALSNQKYRDFKQKYGDDVGLVTGDVQLNPNANCLIVTTEILRNMLYRNNDIIRDIEWVIFDEVHYLNNPERGLVWEETIIMLPETVGFVMLSATVPNYMEFANWVGRTKKRKIYVQKTDFRPVPLEHSIYLNGSIEVIKQGDNRFNATDYDQFKNRIIKTYMNQKNQLTAQKKSLKLEKYQKGILKNTNTSMRNKRTMKAITEKFIKSTDEDDYNSSSSTNEGFNLMQLLIKCQNENLLPCVIFCFSKRKIDEIANQIKQLNFCDYEETVRIEYYFRQCSRKIKSRDLNVPQIQTIKDLLLRGIGIHHGDVIPFMKEVVEILFSQSLIKVLIATETFAMGINMPTKTVIFHSLKKFDSSGERLLNSSEFTQMSGRAGRRGLDVKGNVIIFVNSIEQLPSKNDLNIIMDTKGQYLESKFKITYETIINLLNSNVLNVIDMMKKSYQENHKYAQLPNNIKKIKELKLKYLELKNMKCKLQPPGIDELPIEKYIQSSQIMRQLNKNYFQQVKTYMVEKMELPSYCVMYDDVYKFYFGMIIYINLKDKYEDRFLYVLYVDSIDVQQGPIFNFQEDAFHSHVVENHHYCDESNDYKEYTYKIFKLPVSCICKIYEDDPGIEDGELEDQEYVQSCVKLLISKKNQFKEVFLSEEISSKKMKRKKFLDMKFQNTTDISKSALNNNLDSIQTSLCHQCDIKDLHISQVFERKQIKTDLEELIKKVDENDLNQRTSFESKLKILKRFGYVDLVNKPTFKARIAKEIQNIYVTEVIFQESLESLEECDIAALLSGFVCQAKSKSAVKYDPIDDFSPFYPNYDNFMESYLEIIQSVKAVISYECQFGVIQCGNEDDYMFDQVYIRDLIEVVYQWMNGMDFQNICEMTSIQEGAIVRSFLRLENLLKNVRNGYIIMGNYAMGVKLDRCMEMLKKDIIFSKSLYLDQDDH
ncbi:DEAD/DEAH-box helicase family protein (macronuclear) [Tetrahymena thermophila SB210]|uniref:DEAD/DEAH-box helicase family protein n=1 Tax=Tetrahymena thermophila (strain SB210) TaxID=312017 RepID=Q23RU6_TETTS|nr:DEAD/DEAH-box helicase family protein [Tetrahymena thermophila SB210]EAR99293.2 DEAD/DEAH-box helicase family protein [Tetrahymena thermophila SB210]|eukprot:XP_001019538.2 DEAD/DEAH-box helicase family protein [Tetrahymena thermophila SB210]